MLNHPNLKNIWLPLVALNLLAITNFIVDIFSIQEKWQSNKLIMYPVLLCIFLYFSSEYMLIKFLHYCVLDSA